MAMRLLMTFFSLLMMGCASSSYIRVSDIPYVEDGHARQSGDLYLPRGEGPWPTIILLHGGGWIRRDRSDMARKARRLARAGFAVYNAGYRLAPEYRFPAQLEDVYAAQRALRALANDYPVLPERSALMGYSAGGHLALLAAARPGPDTPVLLAVISGSGPTDVSVYPRSPYLIPFIGGTPDEKPYEYFAASPRNFVTSAHPPAFLYHGRRDRLVEVEQSRDHFAVLQATGVPSEYHEFRFQGHFGVYLFNRRPMQASIRFLKEHLVLPFAE